MTTRTSDHDAAPAAPAAGYDDTRARVDAAHLGMRSTVAAPHTPAQVREAARALTRALHDATAAATCALHTATAEAEPPPRRRWRRSPADRSDLPAVRSWSAELVRLAEIRVWLRRVALDEPGVHLPATVRVADYAATGPHIAGMGFAARPAATGEPRIGIDLTAVLDAAGSPLVTPRTDAPGPAAVPDVAKVA